MKTLAVDFDGTLCENCFPYIGRPKRGVIAYVRAMAGRGVKIILHTCREDGTKGKYLSEAIAWCEKQQIPIDAINENPFQDFGNGGVKVIRKIYADAYLDDRAIQPQEAEKWVKKHEKQA